MVEGARLESVYRSKAYRGFESLSLRKTIEKLAERLAFLFLQASKAINQKFIYLRYAIPTHHPFRLSNFPFGVYREKASKKFIYQDGLRGNCADFDGISKL